MAPNGAGRFNIPRITVLLTVFLLNLLSSHALEQCSPPIPPIASPPSSINLWASLTVSETTKIQEWLEAPAQNLNLTRAAQSTFSDNVIFLIENIDPTQTHTVTVLNNGTRRLTVSSFVNYAITPP